MNSSVPTPSTIVKILHAAFSTPVSISLALLMWGE